MKSIGSSRNCSVIKGQTHETAIGSLLLRWPLCVSAVGLSRGSPATGKCCCAQHRCKKASCGDTSQQGLIQAETRRESGLHVHVRLEELEIVAALFLDVVHRRVRILD